MPGDISSAAFVIAAAVLLEKSSIIIKNTGINTHRLGFIQKLIEMGANIVLYNRRIRYGEPVADIKAEYSANLKGVRVNKSFVSSMIDEIPIFCIIACYARGESIIEGVQELEFKESNRISAIIENIRLMGGNIAFNNNTLLITPKNKLHYTNIKSYDDHRIFMSFYIANLVAGASINNQKIDLCYKKSFPEFIDLIRRIVK